MQVALLLGFRGSIAYLLVRLLLISFFLNTRVQDLDGILIIISFTIVSIIIIARYTIASLVIYSAAVAISSAASPIVSIIIVLASMAASDTLAVEYASAMTSSSWTLDISYVINLLPALVVEGVPDIIRDVEDIRYMSTSNVAADRNL